MLSYLVILVEEAKCFAKELLGGHEVFVSLVITIYVSDYIWYQLHIRFYFVVGVARNHNRKHQLWRRCSHRMDLGAMVGTVRDLGYCGHPGSHLETTDRLHPKSWTWSLTVWGRIVDRRPKPDSCRWQIRKLRISFCWYKFVAYPLRLQIGNLKIVNKKCSNHNNSYVNYFSKAIATATMHQTLFCTFHANYEHFYFNTANFVVICFDNLLFSRIVIRFKSKIVRTYTYIYMYINSQFALS